MPLHRVIWEIDIEADTARDAARKALDIQRNPKSIATVFKVANPERTVEIDLDRPTTIRRRPVRAHTT